MHKIKRVLLGSPLIGVRLLIGLSCLTWAILLMFPAPAFERPVYALMKYIAPEEVWAACFFIAGVIKVYGVLCYSNNNWFLLACSFFCSMLWSVSTSAMFGVMWPMQETLVDALLHYAPPAGFSGNIWIAFAAWWCFIRRWAGGKDYG